MARKFERYAGSILDSDRIQALIDRVADLENEGDVSNIARLIRA
jgi:hypothetical protein